MVNQCKKILEQKMKTLKTDVLIIGSGFGAAPPALHFSEQGYNVLIIEKGDHIIPEKDFKQTMDPKYLLKYIKSVKGEGVQFTFAEGLGGGSGFYEMVSFRAPSIAFNLKDESGRSVWPSGVNRKILDPYYVIAETNMNVHQIPKEEVPKSGIVFSTLMGNLGYSIDRVNYSVKDCRGSSFCVAGCTFGSKQNLINTYFHEAEKKGLKTLTNIQAEQIIPLNTNGHIKQYRMEEIPYRFQINALSNTGEERLTIFTKILVLAAGTVGTAVLLLKSRKHFEKASEQIGKNINVNGSVKTLGLLPPDFIEGDMFVGQSHPGVVSYEFLDTWGITISTAKPLPVDAVSTAHFKVEADNRNPSWWGTAHVDFMKNFRRKAFVLYALGLSTSSAELRSNGNGSFKPKLNIDDSFREYYKNTVELLHSIFRRNNAKIVNLDFIDGEGNEYHDIHISTAHMTGSCRMADNIEQGVVDMKGEMFNYPGLYITDGSVIPSSLAVNPYLTILANSERMTEMITNSYNRN
jgi:choline dehydrogenase-like flavoprotein